MNSNILDTTDHMVHGHEGWLKPTPSQILKGNSIELSFGWGHNMESHGMARKNGLSAYVVTPGGKRRELKISRQTEESYVIDFVAEENGMYHFICENKGYYAISPEGKYLCGTLKDYPNSLTATYYRQFSHTCLLVGRNPPGKAIETLPQLPFSFFPHQLKRWQVGDEIIFNLQKENNMIPDVEIDMAHAVDPEGLVSQKKFHTDEEGSLRFHIEEPGDYLFIPRHRTPQGKADFYYDTSLTYTFFFNIA